jgi:indolepyruvate ferredoxin oxidoreductase alpha subunit
VTLLENYEMARGIANDCRWNFVDGSGSLGVVCSGVSYAYAKDAVAELGMADRIRILRIGFSHPIPDRLVKDFLSGCERVLVIEEGEPFLEEAIKACAQEAGLTLPVHGKGEGLFSRLYEFDPLMVKTVMASYFDLPFTAPAALDLSDVPEIPGRPPTLCAGCSHRAVFYAVKQATKGMDVIHPSDIGCYTLGFLPPLAMGDFVICMGASTSTPAGFSIATGKKVLSFIGDSTFFHSGISGLINAVFNNHDMTLIILDNRVTAMTGHQPNPGVDMAELNLSGYNTVDIESVVRGLGVQHVSVIRPYNLSKSIEAIKEALDFKGVSVIIAKEKCVLYAKSLKQLKGKAFEINQDKCKNHRDCINTIACPAFYLDGDRVKINADMCTGCSVCAQICPEKAIRPVKVS